jgi:Mg-chelatase subunit ChlD
VFKSLKPFILVLCAAFYVTPAMPDELSRQSSIDSSLTLAAAQTGKSRFLQGGLIEYGLDAGRENSTTQMGTIQAEQQAGLLQESAIQDANGNNRLSARAANNPLEAKIVEQLRDHQVVLIIDESGSMGTQDCQGTTRWNWVARQSGKLAQAAKEACSDLSIILFSSGYQPMWHVNPDSIQAIFSRLGPGGGTELSAPLNAVFDRYFKSRALNPDTKPLIVVVITDGYPQDRGRVVDTIAEAANATTHDGEIVVNFFLVDGSLSGSSWWEGLNSRLHARRDIVNLVEYFQLLRRGVVGALSEALKDNLVEAPPRQ